MAEARNQHFLPQLLLAGFASSSGEKGQKRAWRFPREGDPVLTNIRNIGARRDFHGRGGVEEKLSRDEGAHAQVVAALREGRIPSGWETRCADFVSQMVVRTKNLRDGLVRFWEDMVECYDEVLAERKVVDALVKNALRSPEVAALLRGIPRWRRRQLIAEQRAETVNDMRRKIRTLRSPLITGRAAERQIAALAGPVDSIERTRVLRQLQWSVVEVGSGAFVLGDVGPIARKDGVDALVSVLDCNAEVPMAVLLPVSDRHLLLGQRAPGAVFVDVETINLASVELSRDFFVAARNTERERAYVRDLARRAAFMTREEMKVRKLPPPVR